MEFLNEYGGFIMLYLIFQVGLATYIRLLGRMCPESDPMYIGLKTYKIMLIPLLGILYGVFCVIKLAFKK